MRFLLLLSRVLVSGSAGHSTAAEIRDQGRWDSVLTGRLTTFLALS